MAEEIYRYYKAISRQVALGEKLYFGQKGSPFSSSPKAQDRVLTYPKIGIYTGSGASHSWLWFVEIFDRMGFYDLAFLEEDKMQADGLDELDVLIMSGGDTFAIAEGLGADGARKIEAFVKGGGLYIGSCAGAYLPLRSSKPHLNYFNFVNVKIANLTKILPEAKGASEKFCTPYGCSYIFHPVREEVKVVTKGIEPFTPVGFFCAPLYGGPIMFASEDTEVLANYAGFTEKSVLLVEEHLALHTLIGKAAAIKSKMGAGYFYLFGPHFEHPRYPVANKLVADAIYWDMRRVESKNQNDSPMIALTDRTKKSVIRDIKRELSNSRIVASGMELMPIRWIIGKKIYEPAKIRMFLEIMFSRINLLEKWDMLMVREGEPDKMVRSASFITVLLKRIKKDLENRIDTGCLARELFDNLKRMTAMFLDMYFRTIVIVFKR